MKRLRQAKQLQRSQYVINITKVTLDNVKGYSTGFIDELNNTLEHKQKSCVYPVPQLSDPVLSPNRKINFSMKCAAQHL